MTTPVQLILQDAYRESQINAIGVSPTALQITESLPFLQRLIASSYGNEEGERLDPFPLGRNNVQVPQGYPWYDQNPPYPWTVPPNTRMMLNLETATTVYLDPKPMDGQRMAYIDKSSNLATFPITIVGNGRTIVGADQLVVNTNGANAEYLYRDDTGDWALVSPLGINDTLPFPQDFDDYFIIGVAMRLNPRNGPALDSQSVQAYSRIRNAFIARYRQIRQKSSELGLIRTPGTRFYWGLGNWGDYGEDQFLTGQAWPFGGGY